MLRASQATPAQTAPRFAFGAAGRATDGAALRASVPVRYLGAAPIVVRGAATGHAYRFAGGRPVQVVDARDLAGLLKKGLFRRSN